MPSDKRLYPLNECNIGIWGTPDKKRTYLLLLPEKKLFVVLLTRDHDVQGRRKDTSVSLNALLCGVRSQVSLWLRHKNPFVDHTQAPHSDTSVLAFEVSWQDVVGMDFSWRLTEDARLVLESAHITKRVFEDVEAVCAHYQPQPCGSSPRVRLRQLAPSSAAAAAAAGTGTLQDQPQQEHQRHACQQLPLPVPAESARAAHSAASSCGRAVAVPGTSSPARASPACGSPVAAVLSIINKQHAVALACDKQQQQQQQQQPGSISRGSSWTFLASWTSRRSSVELHTSTAAAAAAAAAVAGLHTASSAACRAVPAGQQQEQAQERDQQQHQHQHHDGMQQPSVRYQELPLSEEQVASSSQQQLPCSCSNGCSSPSRLFKVPTLERGVGTVLAAACAADQEAAAAAAAADSTSRPSGPLQLPQLHAAASGSSLSDMSPTIAFTVSPEFSTAAHGCTELEFRPLRGDAAAAAARCDDEGSGDSTPAAAAGSGGSFGLWLKPRPVRLLADGTPAGACTAPCSMPGSPKVTKPYQQPQQQLLLQQDLHQPLQQLYEQQQEQQVAPQQQQQRHGAANSSGGSKASRVRTAAATAVRSCPLCNQPLLHPLHVTQQRFHQRMEQQQDGRGRRGGSRPGSSISRSSKLSAGKSRSACSLSQLGILEAKAAASSASSSCQLPEQLQQRQQLDSAKGLAAAVGSLAAWCMPGAAQAAAAATAAAAGAAAQPAGSAAAAGNPISAAGAAAAASRACTDGVAAGAAAGGVAAGVADLAEPEAGHVLQGVQAGDEDAAAAAAAGVQAGPAAASTGACPIGSACAAPSGIVASAGAADGKVVYSCRTVVMKFRDPTLPHQLSKILKNEAKSSMRLLKLYESGLPGWAIWLPSYGLWYRPWMRRVTWLLFVLLSVVSMAMGFYDLYKNVPYFKQAIVAMFSPAAAVFEWLEHHTQVRLSILLTYMLGKSQLLVQLATLIASTSLQPIIGPIAALLTALWSAASAAAAALAWLVQPFVAAGRLLLLLLQAVWQPLSLLLQVLLPGAASLRAGWSAAKATGQVAKNAAPVVTGAAKTAAKAASSGWSIWWWGWGWGMFEPLELMRVSTMRIMRALQAVMRFFVALGVAINRHRLSLMLQMRQKLRGGLRAAAHSPAGRAASAVAVKMGQEERVARLQQRLQRADSGLISVGSELLGYADSLVAGSVMSLEGELSLGFAGLNGDGFIGQRNEGSFNMLRHGQGQGSGQRGGQSDSDDEVTSGVTRTPWASPMRNSGGLRHRAAAGAGSSGDSVRTGNGCSKQVTFAGCSVTEQQQQAVAAAWRHRQQSGSGVARLSFDAATAARYQLGWQGQPAAASAAEGQLLLTAGARSPQARAGSRSGSNLGHLPGSWQDAAGAADVGSLPPCEGFRKQQQHVDVGSGVWQKLELASAGHFSRSYDAEGAEAFAGGTAAQHVGGEGRLGAAGGGAAVGKFEGFAGAAAVAARVQRRNSWG